MSTQYLDKTGLAYFWGKIKAYISSVLPTKTSDLTNDSGFITGYTETDPTVPSWAKASSKPSYTASEVGAVPTTRKVNNKALSADISLTASDVGALSIESSGTTNGWTYRKFSDGTLEMWGTATDSTKPSTSDAGGYRTTGVTPSNFPITFIDIPIVNVNIRCAALVLTPVCISNPSTTSAGKWAGYRVSTNNSTADKVFMFHCIGRWKS